MLKIESSDEDPFAFEVTVHDQGEEMTNIVDRFHALSTAINYVGEITRRESEKEELDSEQ